MDEFFRIVLFLFICIGVIIWRPDDIIYMLKHLAELALIALVVYLLFLNASSPEQKSWQEILDEHKDVMRSSYCHHVHHLTDLCLDRSLVGIDVIDEKRQAEVARLARVAAELEEALLQFQRKSNELAEQTQQHDSLKHLSHLEGDEERARDAAKPDPERTNFDEQIDATLLELETLKAHLALGLARFEVENAWLSGVQEAFEQQLADDELRLSEAHGRLAALQDMASDQLALGDDPDFEQMVEQQVLSVRQLEARVRQLREQKAATDVKVATLSGNCEKMRRQLEHLRQGGASARANK
ncbi:uncharacterized protein LOC132198477 isoform X2 [Neocloeon triangulifer]|uniref:uncharacterized protein LOC132198477 isoform X2 n=1 Tax=Neocloeon triangulifer TaxID=2078957 RepID=UPI00286EB604|nr:uncharacterized protein LOC132198477 isoform X2 [Neocloeon triangulifer]